MFQIISPSSKGQDQFSFVNLQSAKDLVQCSNAELRSGLVKRIMHGPHARDIDTKGDGTIRGQVVQERGDLSAVQIWDLRLQSGEESYL